LLAAENSTLHGFKATLQLLQAAKPYRLLMCYTTVTKECGVLLGLLLLHTIVN